MENGVDMSQYENWTAVSPEAEVQYESSQDGPGGHSVPASVAEECCDEVYEDDGRSSDGEDHGGDWGSHSEADHAAESDDYSY